MSRHRKSVFQIENIRTGAVVAEADSLRLLDRFEIGEGYVLLKNYEPEQVMAE